MDFNGRVNINSSNAQLDICNDARLTAYMDKGGSLHYLVIGITALNNTTQEELYFSVRNNILYIDHKTPNGTWAPAIELSGYSNGSGIKQSSFDGWLNWNKYGQICMINWWFKCPVGLNTYSATGNLFSGLPVGVRDGVQLISKMDNSTGTAFLNVNNSGIVKLSSRETSISSGQIITGSGIYMCNP